MPDFASSEKLLGDFFVAIANVFQALKVLWVYCVLFSLQLTFLTSAMSAKERFKERKCLVRKAFVNSRQI